MKTIAKVLGDKEEDDVKRNEDIKEETKGRPKRWVVWGVSFKISLSLQTKGRKFYSWEDHKEVDGGHEH